MRQIRRVIVHHTDSPDTTSVSDVDRWHRARGWRGIGYHWLVHRPASGEPWTCDRGRGEEEVGAHDGGQNSDSIGVAIAGRFSRDAPSGPAWYAAAAVVADCCLRNGLTAANVEVHRENEPSNTPTDCPGRFWSMDAFRDLVARAMEDQA